MARLLTFVLFVAFCLATVTAKCNHICTQEYNPVCGRNRSGEHKTFSNLCEFNSVQCENSAASWIMLKDGACTETKTAKCSQICTLQYNPVCGRNQNGELKTFSNLCMFVSAQCENSAAGWIRMKDGACMETKGATCNHACFEDYTPVCGRNRNGELKTFSNLCELDIVQCEKPTAGWFRLKDGACMETRAAKCNQICSADYSPICGRNQNGELKTFGNLCMFNSAQCENPAAAWFVLKAGACMETRAAKCNQICSADYSPVCGRNQNGELKTFGNLCMFNSAQCENPAAAWFILKAEACMETRTTKCNKICPADYSPVCGRNQNGELKTFGNLCMFNSAQCANPAAGWFMQSVRACAATIAVQQCNHICTDDYTPVCGRNRNGELKTFSNLCELNIVQCEGPTKEWFRLSDGACE